MNRSISRMLALCLILALCLCCSSHAFADGKDRLRAKTASPEKASASAAVIKDVKKLMDDGKMYDAARACYDGYIDYPDAQDEFEKLWDKITDACAGNRPKTGELERRFKYQGANQLLMTANSGNVEMTALDVDSKESVRVFIRKGESFTLYLPAGSYDLSYKVGDIWFDDKIGFGDFCADYPNIEHLDIKYVADASWITSYNYTWEM